MVNSQSAWSILKVHGQFSNYMVNSQTIWSILKVHGQFSKCMVNSQTTWSILKLYGQFSKCMVNSQTTWSILKLYGQFSKCMVNSQSTHAWSILKFMVMLIFSNFTLWSIIKCCAIQRHVPLGKCIVYTNSLGWKEVGIVPAD